MYLVREACMHFSRFQPVEALRTIFPAYDLDFSQSLSFDCLLVASQLALLDISDLSIFMKSNSL